MAASALVALISTTTAVATAGGIGAFTFFGMAGFAAVATSFLVTTAMGAALNALAPKPNLGNLGASRGYSISGESGSALDHQIVYGRVRVGGVRIYDASTGDNNEFLHRIIALTGHEIESYDEIYLNDEAVTLDGSGNVTSPSRYNGFVRIKKYFGTTSQTADTDLVSETASLPVDAGRWTTDHRLQGIAYLYIRFKYSADAFPNGIPSVSATVKGRKVYDPRTATTYWTDNPALCIRDYLTSEFGFNQPSSRIDENSVVAAANLSDQIVDGEKRYTCNGNFVTNFAPNQVLSDLLTSMGGLLWYSQGKWRMKAASYVTPTITLDENDLRSSISLSTRHSRRVNFNAVKGKFKGPETDFQEADYPTVTDPAFVIADNGLVNTLDYSLPFTTSSKTAQRIANIALRRNREQLTFSASFGLKAFQVQVGDFVYINNERFGWSNKPFEITNWTFGLTEGLDLQVQMTLREISSSVFTDEDGSVFETNNTTLPNPFTGLEVNNLVASGGGRLQSDGTFINSVILNWDAVANQFVEHYEVEWKPVVDSDYSSTTTTSNSVEVSPLIDQIQYEIRVRAVSANGIRGPWTSVLFTGGGDVTAPSLPTAISAVGGFKYVTVKWTNPPESDFNYVEVWENATNTTVGATKVGISSGDTFQRTNLPIDTTKWYFLKSVDYSGNVSGFTSGVSATTTGVEDDDFANGIYSLFTDQGLYAIKDVTVLPAAGSFTGEKVFNRTDGKLYQWTGTAWELVVAEPDTFIASDKIIANTITGGLLATSGIITNSAQINDLVVTNAKIANSAITSAKISDAAITTAKIGVAEVDTLRIAGNAVTVPVAAYATSTVNLNSTETTILSASLTREGFPTNVIVAFNAAGTSGSTIFRGVFVLRIKRNGVTVFTGGGCYLADPIAETSHTFLYTDTDTGVGATTYTVTIVRGAGGFGDGYVYERGMQIQHVKR